MLPQKHLVRLARSIALRYKKRCWWADVEDLTQEAWIAILTAQRTFDPTVGVDEGAYLWRAAVYHLRAVLWRMSSPASASFHDLPSLKNAHRAPEVVAAQPHQHRRNCDYSEKYGNPLIPTTTTMDVETPDWREKVRAVLVEVAKATRSGVFLAECLTDLTPAEASEIFGIEPREIYKERGKFVRLAEQSADLWDLWQERNTE